MSLTTTLIGLGVALVLFALSTWQARRERAPGAPALIPWTGLQFVAIAVAMLLLAHLVTLLTGKPLLGRLG